MNKATMLEMLDTLYPLTASGSLNVFTEAKTNHFFDIQRTNRHPARPASM